MSDNDAETSVSSDLSQRSLQERHIQVDCVIIGAGAAGLQTAASLCDHKHDNNNHKVSFVILEARDRVGGRIWTTTTENVPTVHGGTSTLIRDLGAAWIHGTGGMVPGQDKNPMVELLEEAANGEKNHESLLYPVFPGNAWTRPDSILHRPGNIALYVDGTFISNDSPVVSQAIRRHYDLLRTMSQYSNSLFEAGEGFKMNELSVEEVRTEILKDIQHDPVENQQLVDEVWPFYLFLIENWNGVSINDIQLSLMVGFEDDEDQEESPTTTTDEVYKCEGDYEGPHCKVKSGTATVLEPLLRKIGPKNIRLNETVVSIINRGSPGIRIETARGTILDTECCVSTIPLGCLQANSEQLFQPRLSEEKREAIQSIWSGSYKKVFLTFKDIFWPTNVPAIGLIRRTPKSSTNALPGNYLLLTNLFAKDGIPSLEAVLCGDLGKWAFEKSDEVIRMEVLRFIESSMGVFNLSEICVACHVTRWEEDEFTRGSYSTFCLGTKDCHVDAIRVPEWDGKLCFAGEPTESEHMGSVHAALTSGKRAANEILTYLTNKVLLSDSLQID